MDVLTAHIKKIAASVVLDGTKSLEEMEKQLVEHFLRDLDGALTKLVAAYIDEMNEFEEKHGVKG